MSGGGSDDNTGNCSRRQLLLGLAVSASGVAAAARTGEGAEPKTPEIGRRPRWGMVIDLQRCARCGACVVACQAENNVAPAGPTLADETRPIHWMDLLHPDPGQSGSEAALPVPCMHCEDPPCVKVCPVGATYQTEEGITAQIWDRCIGCRYCMLACPYSRRYFNWTTPSWPGQDPSSLNPDVAPRPAGVVEKCVLCHHRIRSLIERSRVDEEPITDESLRYLPACAQSCPTGAIVFGDLNDPESMVSRLAQDGRAFRLLDQVGSRPKVIYLKEEQR